MKYLVDTHLLLWAAGSPERLSSDAAEVFNVADNELIFSAVSIWEVAIKLGLGRADFIADPRLLRRGLLDSGYIELPVTSEHAATVVGLPSIHKDPFDRMLVAQARVEGVTLLTSDAQVAAYGDPVRSV